MILKPFSRIVFVLLFLAYCSHGIWSQQQYGESVTETMQNSEPPLTQQMPENSSNDMTQQSPNLDESAPPLLNPNNPWNDLRILIADGLQGLSESSESLNQLEQELAALKTETKEQKELYEESQRLLMSLKQSLAEAQNNVDIAVDRMQDAEGYALWIDAQNIELKQDVERLKKSTPIAFVFGGIGFGIGIPLVLEGIRSDNKTMLWSGTGVTLGSGLIWAAGHYLFEWW